MTISTEPTRLSYNGDGATTAFAITWRYFEKSHIVATLRSSTGVETVQVLDTDYTLTAPAATGTLTMTTAPATGETLIIEIDVPNTQPTSLPLAGALPSDSIEEELDKAAQRDSQLEGLFNRCISVPTSDSSASLTLPNDSSRANKALTFDASGNPEVTAFSSSSDIAFALIDMQVFTADGTWSKPTGTMVVEVFVVGGGGGGGSAAATSASQVSVGAGGGGGGGSYKVISSGIGSTESVFIGLGGAGGTSGGAGNNGASSSFGAHATALGGSGGSGGTAATPPAISSTSGAGGTAINGDINLTGQPGGDGIGVSTGLVIAGSGGSPGIQLFSNTVKPITASTSNVSARSSGHYGNGGRGNANTASQSAFPASNGSPGIIIVKSYG